jgi:hypothetical protein
MFLDWHPTVTMQEDVYLLSTRFEPFRYSYTVHLLTKKLQWSFLGSEQFVSFYEDDHP